MATWRRALINPVQDMFKVDIVRRGYAAVTVEKQYLRRLLAQFQVDCVFDVGANEGQYGDVLREIGYRGPIISFEPIPALLERLRKTAARDGRWFVEPVALDSEARDAVFNITERSEFSSLKTPSSAETRLFETPNKTVTRLELRTQTLGPFVADYRARLGFSRPYLKLDTQGNDVAIVRGAEDAIGAFVGLQSEVAIKRLYEDQPDYIQSIAYYQSLGFQLGALTPNNEGHFPLLVELDCIMLNNAFLTDRRVG